MQQFSVSGKTCVYTDLGIFSSSICCYFVIKACIYMHTLRHMYVYLLTNKSERMNAKISQCYLWVPGVIISILYFLNILC